MRGPNPPPRTHGRHEQSPDHGTRSVVCSHSWLACARQKHACEACADAVGRRYRSAASTFATPASLGPRNRGSGSKTASRAALPAAKISRVPP